MSVATLPLSQLYHRMWLIRYFDQSARELFMQNLLRGTTHTCLGQEAVAVGACAALRRDDFITSTHRGHGHCLAKGSDPKRMMAELLGKATGYGKGKGGSMHIADLDLGILGANGIVGGGMGIATGAAYSADLRGSGQVVICFFGDGASNQGLLMEVANMAALWKLPIIYLCEANQYAEFSPVAPFLAVERLESKAQAFGMPGVTVDGNDLLAVYEAANRAVARARAGGGPTFLVAQTYRIEGHTVGDPLSYRPQGETEQWKAPDRDPISRFGQRLLAEFGFTAGQLDSLRQRARADIDDAIAFAKASPEPEMGSLWEDVYA
ncbi:MAG: thiamine pyrophosphate-dependent dehydrogenase E1 component subunit alpha [Caldilineales bacterium]|nr:thiamine pyrophosphate-dependent dehydrogenase E1 component subunit alpha [Caldilineales bacterium]MCW5860879.1 thiamine pyrophosphate-dependent dehydrogenase E1 component subunit alpha [Caldilineales bacterium]